MMLHGLRRTGKAGRGVCRTSSNPSASCQRKLKRVSYGHVPSDGNVTADNLAKQKH